MSHHLRFTAEVGALSLRAEADFSNTMITLSGENGSGKTTLLRILAGLTQAHGSLMVDHRLWLDSSANFVLPPQMRQLGCLWHHPALLPWLTVADNIALGAASNPQQLQTMATELQIDHLLQRRPTMLSTGEAQRVALARAAYRQPDMLLLDEPFSAQAPKLRSSLRLWLCTLQQSRQIPVVVVSHDMEDITALGGYHWRMREGRLWTGIEQPQESARSSHEQLNPL